jgi:hypothetical protein
MKTPLIFGFLASVCLSGAASAAWLRLPAADKEPVNLASSIFVGTKVQSSAGITNPAALLAGSSSEAAELGAGKSEAVISIGEQQIVDQVSFVNDGVAGKMVISSSTDLQQWTSLAQATFAATDREVPVNFAGVQAKYIRLEFDSATASSIRDVRLGGSATTQDFTTVPIKNAKGEEVNLASGSLGAYPVYVYPTPVNLGERDALQALKFPKSQDRFRTVVYDLGSVRTIKKFDAAYSRVPTRVQVYSFAQLPEKKDWRGKMTLDSSAFEELKPLATVEDARGDGHVQISPEHPVEAQFIALRFEPNYDKPAVSGLNPDWRGMALAAAIPFAGVVKELGITDSSKVEANAEEGGDDFVVYDASASGTLPIVLISRTSIALVTQQLGPAASEAQAIDTILTAAGLAAISNATVTTSKTGANSQTTGPGSTPSSDSSGGLDALGLSAYRGSGGGGGSNPFGPSIGSFSGGTGTGAGTVPTGNIPPVSGGGRAPTGTVDIPPTSP